MSTSAEEYNAQDYEERYRRGYGLRYPESHIIRIHRHILEWELGLTSGRVFDFGCGAGANLGYFQDQGFEPFGCDTSGSAIDACRRAMPDHAANFHVSDVAPVLSSYVEPGTVDVFLSNQVLYFLADVQIRDVVAQAHELVRPGGILVATMMAPSCFYRDHASGTEGDFQRVALDTPRQQVETLINFKTREELPALFAPFERLHIGSYGSWIREEEGSTDHWIFVGRRP